MTELDAKHVLVRSAQSVGMFTQTDVCRAITDRTDFHTVPVRAYSQFQLHTIHESHDLSEALITMLDKRVHRLPIVNSAGDIVGVIGQTELLNYLSNQSQLITQRIDQAQSLDDVVVGVDMIGKFIRHQTQNGMKIHLIGRIVQSLNAHVFAKVWQLIAPPDVISNTCLIVMGSEGRGEQVMRTDQDNALIIRDGFYDDNLPSYAQAFNDELYELGYPYCDGQIMINNAQWRRSLSEFQAQINSWLIATGGEAMVNVATLVDAHPVCGDASLLEDLKSHWQKPSPPTVKSANFINRFAAPTIQVATTEGFWQKFTGGLDSDVDLKKPASSPSHMGYARLL